VINRNWNHFYAVLFAEGDVSKLSTMMKILHMMATLAVFSAWVTTATAQEAVIEYPEAPDAAVRYVAKELSKMNGGILWDALPNSYQSEIKNLASQASGKIDADNYERVFRLVGRIGQAIDQKGEFILNTKLGGGFPGDESTKLKAALPLVSTLLLDLSKSSLAMHAGLREFDGQAFGQLVSSMLAFVEAALAFDSEQEFSMDDLSELEVKVIQENENTASLETTLLGDEPMAEEYVLVEGRWLPQSFAGLWVEGLANANASLQSVTAEQVEANKAQAAMVLGLLEGVITQIELADSQESFDRALQSAAMPLMGMFMML
jgi:hypothetical protein